MKTINLIIFSIIIILSSCTKYDELPVVKTIEVSNITSDAFNCGGIITISGGSDINNYGLCWSTNSKPTIKDSTKSSNIGEINFMDSITGLIPNTNYYVCAFASNKNGTSYGEVKQIITYNSTLSTSIVSNVSITTATCGGNIINDGGSPITARGVCWSLTSNPTILDNKTIDGSGVGSFTSNMSGLLPNTKYYVKAYSINNKGTSYGKLMVFNTNKLNIGDLYLGGIVADILVPGQIGYSPTETHGLIAALTDLPNSSLTWDPNTVKQSIYISNNENYQYGSGKSNTSKIVNILGAGIYAAKACTDLNSGGFNDWFLPSYNELNTLYRLSKLKGGFSNTTYWSSTEGFIPMNAIGEDFSKGQLVDQPKSYGWSVRPVRYF